MFYSDLYKNPTKYFPFVITEENKDRSLNQLHIIKKIAKEFDNGKKYIILDAPTGFGKSGIARTFCDYLGYYNSSSTILTATKMLMEQYYIECNNKHIDYKLLKGRNNFACVHDKYVTCDIGRCREDDLFKCPHAPNPTKTIEEEEKLEDKILCRYLKHKILANRSDVILSNYDMLILDNIYVKQLHKRDLLIIDEAHNCENKIRKYVQYTINLINDLTRLIEYKIPINEFDKLLKNKSNIEYWVNELKTIELKSKNIIDVLRDKYNDLKQLDKEFKSGKITQSLYKIQKKDIEQYFKNLEFEDHLSVRKTIKSYDTIICFLNDYKQNKKNWIVIGEKNLLKNGNDKFNLIFKPVSISKYTQNSLLKHADEVIFMSGSFIDKKEFVKKLGLNENDVAYINAKSLFDWKNRNPIFYQPVGKMSIKFKKQTFPKLCNKIESLLDKYPSKKGLIHTNSKKLTNELIDSINSERLITYEPFEKDEVICEFKESDEPLVLVSYSCEEGVDLPHENCRFNTIAKVPFPDLSDPLIKEKQRIDRKDYAVETVRLIVQMLGRAMRCEDDYCDNYILDESFDIIYKGKYDYHGLLPEHIKKSIRRG